MHQITNTRCLIKAAKRLGLGVEILDGNKNLLKIGKGKKALLFANYSTPWNDSAVERICKDKEFAHFLLDKKVRMPRAKGFFDPHYKSDGEIQGENGTYEKVVGEILCEFNLPVVLKPNAKSRGANVRVCRSKTAVSFAVRNIFNKKSANYDYVALAEEYVDIKKEFRAVVFRGEILLMYEKDFSKAEFVGNLSPLHWRGSKAVAVRDPLFLARVGKFIKPIFSAINLKYCGLDIVLSKDDELFLIEINTQIGFANFARDMGERAVVEMYGKILKSVTKA